MRFWIFVVKVKNGCILDFWWVLGVNLLRLLCWVITFAPHGGVFKYSLVDVLVYLLDKGERRYAHNRNRGFTWSWTGYRRPPP